MSTSKFCKQLTSTSPGAKQRFLEENYQRVFKDYASSFGNITNVLNSPSPSGTMTSQLVTLSISSSLIDFYSGNFENKVALFESLKNASDLTTCLNIVNKDITEKHKMLQDLNKNKDLISEHSRQVQAIRSENENDSSSNELNCQETMTKTNCSGVPVVFSADTGFNNLILQVAPKVNEGGYNKFCDCSGQANVGASYWKARANTQLKSNIRNRIKKEILRKNFFELLDQQEKNAFINSIKGKESPKKLGCADDSFEMSLAKTCKKHPLDKKLIQEVMGDFVKQSPRARGTAQTIDELEKEIMLMQTSSNSCPQIKFDTYANLQSKVMGMGSKKFYDVYSILMSELNQKDKVQHDSNIYRSALAQIVKSPEKLDLIKEALDLNSNASSDDVMMAFQLFHLESSKNLGMKAILSSPQEMKEIMKNKNPSFSKMLDKLSRHEVQKKQCQELLHEMSVVACGDGSELDLAKYDIDIDAFIDQYGYDLSIEEMQGLCLQRRKNKSNKNLEKIHFTKLPIESQPDVAIYYDPALKGREDLKKSVMDIYATTFCKDNTGLEQATDRDREQRDNIYKNPDLYSGYSDIASYMPGMEKMAHNYISTAKVEDGGDNGRDRFVTNSRHNAQSNIITTPVILNNNQLEMRSYTSVANVKSAVANRSPASLNKTQDEEEKKERLVDQYRELDQDDADYFEKRKELLKQLYSSSEAPSTSLNEQDYLSRIKSLEDELRQKEVQLNTLNGVSPEKARSPGAVSQQSPIDNAQGFISSNKQNDIAIVNIQENGNIEKSAGYSGGGKTGFVDGVHEVNHGLNISRGRSDGLYLNMTSADFSNADFVKSMEIQIRKLISNDIDKLIQQLEDGPLLIDFDGKKFGFNIEDLKKILDVETIKKIEVKLTLAKNKKNNSSPKKLQTTLEKAKVESDIKNIKSEMYKTLLQLSSKLKSQDKI